MKPSPDLLHKLQTPKLIGSPDTGPTAIAVTRHVGWVGLGTAKGYTT
jgi:hypothetical protein